jgi:hypothetical protein
MNFRSKTTRAIPCITESTILITQRAYVMSRLCGQTGFFLCDKFARSTLDVKLRVLIRRYLCLLNVVTCFFFTTKRNTPQQFLHRVTLRANISKANGIKDLYYAHTYVNRQVSLQVGIAKTALVMPRMGDRI